MPGNHRNDRKSRTWFYFPDADTTSPIHCRRRNESVSIRNICNESTMHHRNLPIILKHAHDYMENSPKRKTCSQILVIELLNKKSVGFAYSHVEPRDLQKQFLLFWNKDLECHPIANSNKSHNHSIQSTTSKRKLKEFLQN